MEKPEDTTSTKRSRWTSPILSHVDTIRSLKWCDGRTLHLCGVHPLSEQSQSIYEKIFNKHKWWKFYKILDEYSSEVSRSIMFQSKKKSQFGLCWFQVSYGTLRWRCTRASLVNLFLTYHISYIYIYTLYVHYVFNIYIHQEITVQIKHG